MRRTGFSIVLLLFSTAESQSIDGPFYTSDLKGNKYTPDDQRPGDNLFGESIVCLDAQSGERVWHFQMVHHGLWDLDPPAPPIQRSVSRHTPPER